MVFYMDIYMLPPSLYLSLSLSFSRFLSLSPLSFSLPRYRGRRLGQMVTACVGVCTLLGVGLAVLLFVLTKPQPWRDQCSMVILACVLYPLLKTLGVLVR